MKEFIKQLANEQQELKKARKTGTLEKDYTYWCYRDWPEHITKARNAANRVQANKIKITAALNAYHELRGSSYRHNIEPGLAYVHDKYFKEFLKEYSSVKG